MFDDTHHAEATAKASAVEIETALDDAAAALGACLDQDGVSSKAHASLIMTSWMPGATVLRRDGEDRPDIMEISKGETDRLIRASRSLAHLLACMGISGFRIDTWSRSGNSRSCRLSVRLMDGRVLRAAQPDHSPRWYGKALASLAHFGPSAESRSTWICAAGALDVGHARLLRGTSVLRIPVAPSSLPVVQNY